MFSDFFKPTRTRTLGGGQDYRLFRREGWTSNGYWAIKEDFEPKYIKELKSTKEGEEAPDIKKTVTTAEEKELHELIPSGNMKLVGDVVVVEFDVLPEVNYKVWINVYYYTLFESMEWFKNRPVYPHFFTSGQNEAIVVKTKDGDTIGLIMPVRQN